MRVLIGTVPVLAALLFGCGGDDTSSNPPTVPPPERYRAPEIALKECSQALGGVHVQVAGMSCDDAERISQTFTTAFTDRNLKKTLVDRGNGWRCYQHLSSSAFAVQEVCWRPQGQVLLLKK